MAGEHVVRWPHYEHEQHERGGGVDPAIVLGHGGCAAHRTVVGDVEVDREPGEDE